MRGLAPGGLPAPRPISTTGEACGLALLLLPAALIAGGLGLLALFLWAAVRGVE